VRDEDCPNGYCLVSLYTREHWCVDRSAPCVCTGLLTTQDFCAGATNGCADSPSGLPMVCYDTGAAGAGFCVGVNLPNGANQLSCWR
jgi:hypothetical protein